MSVEAITWALKEPLTHSSSKFVLVVLANCANSETFEAYPSITYLASSTGQDRKTVITNIKRLIESGHIVDTGNRVGRTSQVITYRLNCDGKKESQKRNSTENGTVPFFPPNSTVFPIKESQKRDTETTKETSLIQKNNKPEEVVQLSPMEVNTLQTAGLLFSEIKNLFQTYPKPIIFEKIQLLAIAKEGGKKIHSHGGWLAKALSDNFVANPSAPGPERQASHIPFVPNAPAASPCSTTAPLAEFVEPSQERLDAWLAAAHPMTQKEFAELGFESARLRGTYRAWANQKNH
ncbi:hypothetical protein D521_0460 [beta proteobacterium CB]|nr:hypothetical protein D521_0460 [beta proteobacterium CB]